MADTKDVRITLTGPEHDALRRRAKRRRWPLTTTAREAMVLGLEIQRRADDGTTVVLRAPDGKEETMAMGVVR